jgi:hypothetical protein
MLAALLAAAGLALVATAYGGAALGGLARLAGGERRPLPRLPVLALTGLAVLSAGALLASLVVPLDGRALAVTLAGAALLAVVRRRALAAALRDLRGTLQDGLAAGRGLGAAALAAGALLGLVRTAVATTHFDTAAYQLQAIRWLQEVGAVPGLGNLHGRLAFAAGWFAPQALLGQLQVLNGALFLLVLVDGVAALGEWRRGARRASLLVRLATPVLTFHLFASWLSAATPDVPAAVLVWVAAALWLEAVEEGPLAAPGPRETAVVVLCAFAASVKLSALPLLLLPLWLVARLAAARRWRAAGALAGTALVFVAPALLHSAVVSGYLLFPVPGLDPLPVDWRIPAEWVATHARWITSFSRSQLLPAEVVMAMPLREWAPLWWDDLLLSTKAALLACLALAPAQAGFWLARQRRPLPPGALDRAVLFATAAAGVLFWLAAAPAPRFGWGFLFLLTLLSVGPFFLAVARRLPAGALAGLLLAYFAVRGAQTLTREPRVFTEAARRAVLPAAAPVPPTRATVRDGLALRVTLDGRCGYRPFPCAPEPDPRLELRGPTLASGFRIPSPR